MKKKAILILSAVLAVLLVAGISVFAQGGGWEYYAYGTIDGYEAVESAEIIPPGFWNLKVQGNKIGLRARASLIQPFWFTEMNYGDVRIKLLIRVW